MYVHKPFSCFGRPSGVSFIHPSLGAGWIGDGGGWVRGGPHGRRLSVLGASKEALVLPVNHLKKGGSRPKKSGAAP